MIEKILYKYLTEKLEIPVFLEYPKDEPEEYIVFVKTSSTQRNLIYTSSFDIYTHSLSMYKTITLTERLKEVMKEIIEVPEIMHAEFISDYEASDTTTKTYRYKAIYDIKH